MFDGYNFTVVTFLFCLYKDGEMTRMFTSFVIGGYCLVFTILLVVAFLVSFCLIQGGSFGSMGIATAVKFAVLSFTGMLVFCLLLIA